LRPVHDRHDRVEQDQMRRPGGGGGHGVAAAACTAHREAPIEVEGELDHGADVRLVVDVKNPDLGHAVSFSLAGLTPAVATRLRRVATRSCTDVGREVKAACIWAAEAGLASRPENMMTGMASPSRSRRSGMRSSPPAPAMAMS